jgi:DNA modification methylase
MSTKIHQGDVREVLAGFRAGAFDGCLTDPPYGLKFMGKAWDHGVPGAETWAEVLRVLKPGAWLLAFGGTRTYHRLTCAIEDAGFDVKDCLVWLHSMGFPKGKGLKPAWEPIVLARKRAPAPVLNIDACRIAGEPIIMKNSGSNNGAVRMMGRNRANDAAFRAQPWINTLGRWPANAILDESAAAELDRQSGASRFFYVAKASRRERNAGLEGRVSQKVNDGRRKPIDNPFQRGETPRLNTHPTVKPVKLTEYLAKLILPPVRNAKLLVPFAGSGSEILGARYAGWKHVEGIEISAEYTEIANQRLEAAA